MVMMALIKSDQKENAKNPIKKAMQICMAFGANCPYSNRY